MKQLEEGIYGRNAKTPEEEAYLKNKIAYIFNHRSKVYEHNAKVAEGLSKLAQQMDSLRRFLCGQSSCNSGRNCHKFTINR